MVRSLRPILSTGAALLTLLAGGAVLVRTASHPPRQPLLPVLLPAPARSEPGAPRPAPEPDIRFGRDVRPILADRCFLCHGPDADARAADLRLDDRDSAIADRPGGPAIVPGDADASALWARITSHDPDEHMPPPGSGKSRLTDDQAALLRLWIEAGAPYEDHWAFVPPVRPPLPRVAHPEWVRNPIDHFILQRLEAAGLEPSPEADRATLLRRVFLDLTGLPPTLDELDAFLSDETPDAYERWVDRLLTQEPYVTRYAERMATPWLDQARYADTSGIHMDAGRSIWLWRDWVLNAYRANKPFDRFTIEQLAGDLIPAATTDQIIATGFNRNHVTTDEGGAIDAEYLVEYAVDRVATTGSVFLGLTLGCARCHDHKYDPVSQAEFYSLIAFFNSIQEPGLYSQVPDAQRALEPFISVPSPAQDAQLASLAARLESLQQAATATTPQEQAARDEFVSATPDRLGVVWHRPAVAAAVSEEGATLTTLDDGSVLASGAEPARDAHTITLTTEHTGNNLLLLEALADPSLPKGRVGRNFNGNAVLTHISATVESLADPTAPARQLNLIWAWANLEQGDGDFVVVNALDPDADGWAVDAHRIEGNRVAIFLAKEPFGFEGGSRLTVRLEYNSQYGNHTFGRVRLSVGSAGPEALAALPEARGSWHIAGPFGVAARADAFAHEFGPEHDPLIDPTIEFPDLLGRAPRSDPGLRRWVYAPSVKDGAESSLEPVISATYVGRRLYSPTERSLSLSLGSDDGLRVYASTVQVFANEVDRGVAPDQDRVDNIPLHRGLNALVLKVANTGGVGAVYSRILREPPASADSASPERGPAPPQVMDGILAAAILPDWARWPALDQQIGQAWLESFSPRRRELVAQAATVEADLAAIRAQVPVTMVMKELPEPRPTFVLSRGQYDLPDPERPVTRNVPRILGTLEPPRPDTESLEPPRPLNRLDLAKWLVSPDHPLVARVTVNRLWAQVFGQGIVRTTEDLGLQSDWPSHPALLDWLAVRFREDGWNVRAMMRLLVTSATYRQASRLRPDAAAIDPENRLLAHFPRQRLTGEQIRDQALYLSGLLVEHLGGPSVKPYQPAGLWEEVAMPQSNTRTFQRGMGDDLYRRSLYTYWKRASPPPNMLAFDAPTRESCVVSRGTTNTPLQALALWNDDQLVEAARVLAARILAHRALDPTFSPEDRLTLLARTCTGHTPTPDTLAAMQRTLTYFQERYTRTPEAAAGLLATGVAPLPDDLDRAELAAWTMVTGAVLAGDATITRD